VSRVYKSSLLRGEKRSSPSSTRVFVRRFHYWRKERKLEEGKKFLVYCLSSTGIGRPNTPARRFSAPGMERKAKGGRKEVSFEGGRRERERREKEKGWGKRRTKRSHLVSTLERCASHVGEDGTSGEEEKRGELEE